MVAKVRPVKIEYRMVTVRPPQHTAGKALYFHPKRDPEHLLKGMADHIATQDKVAELLPSYGRWHVYAEYREVPEWTRWGE